MAGLLDYEATDTVEPGLDSSDRTRAMLTAFMSSMKGRDGFAEGLQFADQAVAKKRAVRAEQDTKGLLNYAIQAAQSGMPLDPEVLQQFRYVTPEAVNGLLTQVVQNSRAKQQREQQLADTADERQYSEGLLQRKYQWETDQKDREAKMAALKAEEKAADAEKARTAIGALQRAKTVRTPGLLPPRAANPGLLNMLQRRQPQTVQGKPLEQIGVEDVKSLAPGLLNPATAVQDARAGMLEEAKTRAGIGAQESLADYRKRPASQTARSNERAFLQEFLDANPDASVDDARNAYITYQAKLSGARAGASAAATDYRVTPLPYTDEQGRPLVADKIGNVRAAGTGATTVMSRPSEGDKAFAGVTEGIKGSIARIKENFNPDYVGPVSGRFGTLMGKVKDLPPAQAKFYADILSVGDTELRRRSGAAITPSEMERILQFAPNPNAPSGNFMAQLDRFETELNDIIRARNEARKGKPMQQSGAPATQGASSAADLVDSWLK